MNLIAFDTETTGLEPGSRLVEIAAIRFDDTGPLDTFRRYVNPGMPMPADAAAMNGVSPDALASADLAGVVLAEFFAWLPEDPVLVIHNAPYDCGIVEWALAHGGLGSVTKPRVIDTLQIARTLGETKKNGLQALVEHYGIQRLGEAHRAMSDADAARQYFNIAWPQVEGEPVPWDKAGHDYRYSDLPDALHFLPGLIATGGEFSFIYQDAKGDVTSRTIIPYGWAETPTGLMFHGLSKLRGERRTFRADRVITTTMVAA